MHFHIIIHSEAEPAGAIGNWLKTRGHKSTISRPFLGDSLPPAQSLDGLFIMGGPQSPLKLNAYPYLEKEIDYIKTVAQAKKYTVGFCLGAQLISCAFDGIPQKSPEKEVGVYPITLTTAGKADPLLRDFPKSFDVVHWHYDMPGVPKGAEILATSPGCPRQIIRFAAHVYGFQCHFEFMKKNIERLINVAPQDMEPSLYTQQKEAFLNQDFDAINQKLYHMLDSLIKA